MPSTDTNAIRLDQNPRGNTNYLIRVLLAGAVAVGGAVAGAEGRKLIVSDPQEAKEALRRLLKDPDKTDKLIEAITQDATLENELANDPQVLVNLRRLTGAVERHLRPKDNSQKCWAADGLRPGDVVRGSPGYQYILRDKLNEECPPDQQRDHHSPNAIPPYRRSLFPF